jgi:hypothetical protein
MTIWENSEFDELCSWPYYVGDAAKVIVPNCISLFYEGIGTSCK